MSTYSVPPPPTTPTSTRGSGTHPVNVGHLVMGLAFLGLVGVWAAVQLDAVSNDDVRWLLPLPWVFAGALGLIAMAFAGRRTKVVPAVAARDDTTLTAEDLDEIDRLGDPLDPTDPTDPTDPQDPQDPQDPTDPTDPTHEETR